MSGLDLRNIRPGGDRPKGFAAYRPRGQNALTERRILDLYAEMHAADALPLGPRQVGYRLKERFPGEYAKNPRAGETSFKMVERIVMRLQQARRLRFAWVADASSVVLDPGGWDDPADYLATLPDYERDLRQRQPVVMEIPAEARETLPLIRRVAGERGVLVYSGGGSVGPNLAHRAAGRAVLRAVQRGQSTHFAAITDFDLAGVRNVLRPHVENLSAFLHGTDRRHGDEPGPRVVAAQNSEGATVTMPKTSAVATFEHLALTPEQALALDLIEAAHDREQIQAYVASGTDLWNRDLDLLDGVQKVETEALDPRDLRDLVIAAIDGVVDATALNAVQAEAERERDELAVGLDALIAKYEEGA